MIFHAYIPDLKQWAITLVVWSHHKSNSLRGEQSPQNNTQILSLFCFYPTLNEFAKLILLPIENYMDANKITKMAIVLQNI